MLPMVIIIIVTIMIIYYYCFTIFCYQLIIMSATLKLADFTENPRLFKNPPPVVNVESRQFPVTVHFARRTATDYVTEAFRKTCKVHTQLPDGGILVFLTGQQEVRTLVRRLRRTFPYTDQSQLESEQVHTEEEIENRRSNGRKTSKALKLPAINLDAYPLRDVDIDGKTQMKLLVLVNTICEYVFRNRTFGL
jgi:ATP-dependent RNA helicase DHX37/DHR1